MFICFEGIDGAGKSTQAMLLHANLAASGLDVELVRDPGSTALGKSVRRLILECDDPISPESQALLFSAARAELSAYVKKQLRSGKTVICDRWLLSTLVYQGGIDTALILAIFNATCLTPDLCVLLDILPATAETRRSATSRKDRYERATLADKTNRRAAYLKHACLPQCARHTQIFDASVAETDLHCQIVEAVFQVKSQQRSLQCLK